MGALVAVAPRWLVARLVARWSAPARVLWQYLNACVAPWISALLVALLHTALPWTSFCGSTILAPLQQAMGQ